MIQLALTVGLVTLVIFASIPSFPLASALGPEEFQWMAPIDLTGSGWHGYVDADVVEADGIAIAVLNKLNVKDAEAPWMRAEGRRIQDGVRVWNTTYEKRLGAPPQVLGDEMYALVGIPAETYIESIDEVLAIDPASGSILRSMPLPGGPAHFGSMGVIGNQVIVAAQRQGGTGVSAIDLSIEVVAIDRHSGRTLWEQSIPGHVASTPVGTNAGIVISTWGTGTFSLDAESGMLQWSVPGRPSRDPLTASWSVYVVSETGPYRNMLSRIEAVTGTVIWSSPIPWSDWRPCQPMLVDNLVIVVGGDDPGLPSREQSIHIAAYQAGTGVMAWKVAKPGAWTNCRLNAESAVASEDQVFVAGSDYANDTIGQGVWAFDRTGMALWYSPWFVTPALAHDGTLLGLGIGRTGELFGELQLGHAWIALDTGRGNPMLPIAAFSGPPGSVRQQDFLTFLNQSSSGDRPILAHRWSWASDGYEISSSEEAELSFWLTYNVGHLVVTLSLIDDQFHQNTTSRSYVVEPYEEPLHEAPAASWPTNLVAVLAAGLWAAWRKRNRACP